MNEISLAGKGIVVTGAGGGLGRAYAHALAAAGAGVVVNDVREDVVRNVVEEIAATGGRAVPFAGSVADWDGSAAMIATCAERLGSFDGLVNNAAIQHFASPLEETEDRVRRTVEVNVLGSVFPALHAFGGLAKGAGGCILNVTSGAHIGVPGLTTYGATKGAIASLTYNLAIEAAQYGFRVNALAPVAQTGMSPVDNRKDGVRRPQPAEIAPAVVYLMSDLASGLNGQVVRFDGRSVLLLDQPHFRTTKVSEDIDTPEGVARAFETLAERLAPLGLY